MDLKVELNGKSLLLVLDGRLDTNSSPEFEATINKYLDVIDDLTLDFKDLEYISSAGLRVLLGAQRQMDLHGKMTVINVSEDIIEVFDMTGFSDIINIGE